MVHLGADLEPKVPRVLSTPNVAWSEVTEFRLRARCLQPCGLLGQTNYYGRVDRRVAIQCCADPVLMIDQARTACERSVARTSRLSSKAEGIGLDDCSVPGSPDSLASSRTKSAIMDWVRECRHLLLRYRFLCLA